MPKGKGYNSKLGSGYDEDQLRRNMRGNQNKNPKAKHAEHGGAKKSSHHNMKKY